MRHYQKIPSASYRRIYSRVPRLGVDVVICNSRGVLLSRRSIPPWRGYWHLPGGRVYKFETLASAAQRVCREELGLRGRPLKVLGAIEYLRERRAPWFVTHTVTVVLALQPLGGTLRGSGQGLETAFFRSLPRKVIPAVRKFLVAYRLVKR